MDMETLLYRLRHMKAGGEMCFGCGAEHNCREEGCAIARAEIERDTYKTLFEGLLDRMTMERRVG